MSIEVMKKAQRFLMNSRECDARNDALEAIEQAIAEAEKQEQGEPVAWLCQKDNGHFDVLTDQTCKKCFPVYTTPQQRTFVGLTDDEMKLIDPDGYADGLPQQIQQALKEKNGIAPQGSDNK